MAHVKNGWKQLELLNFPNESESIESAVSTDLDTLFTNVPNLRKKQLRKHPLKVMRERLSGYGKTLNDFYKSASNKEAWELSRAIIERPGIHYPHVYFFSKPGLGKTHLLYGLAKEVLKHQKGYRLYLTTGRELLDRYKSMVKDDGLSVFLAECSDDLDGLFIDDIEPCFEYGPLRRDFCLLFNNLKAKGKQLILTGNEHPESFKKLEQRLAGRLSSLVSAELLDFDKELSNFFAYNFLKKHSIKGKDDLVKELCKKWGSNGYQLEGALSHLKLGYQIEKGIDEEPFGLLEAEKVEEVLNDLKDLKGFPVQSGTHEAEEKVLKEKFVKEEVEDSFLSDGGFAQREAYILKKVAKYFGVSLEDLLGQSRKKDFALPRHLSMYLLHCEEKLSLTRIGNLFRRDHTSILYAAEKIKKAISKKDPEVDFHIRSLKQKTC
tara:strand:+ start:1753 stop:3057 length:1305 start_codon:yes stop_codon:yes gene_type:complete